MRAYPFLLIVALVAHIDFSTSDSASGNYFVYPQFIYPTYNNSSNQVMKLKNNAQIFIPDCVNKSTRCSRFQKENLCKNSQKIRNSCKSMCNLCGKLKEAFIYFSFQKIFLLNIYYLYAECLFMIIFSLRLQ